MARRRVGPPSWARARLGALWLPLALFAPPCQERNPAFDEGGADTGAGGSSGSASTQPGDDGVVTTASDASASATEASASASGDATTNGSATTASPASDGTTDPGTATGSSGGSDGGTTDGCAGTMCGSQCVDLMTDHDNCGECFNSCHPVQEHCEGSMCVHN